MSAAVITLAHGRQRHLDNQHASLRRQRVPPEHYVVVAMDDPGLDLAPVTEGPDIHIVHLSGSPTSLPLSAARNTGASVALELGADVLIFLDVDCLAGEDLVAGYTEAVGAEPGVVWSGPVTYLPPPGPAGYPLDDLAELDSPHPARPAPDVGERVRPAAPELFWSLSFAVHRRAWLPIGGFCEEYTGYGGEDTDYARLALKSGAALGWAGTPRAFHQHHPTSDPPLQHLDAILRNAHLFHRRWGCWPMQGWLRAFADQGLIEQGGGGWVRTGAPMPTGRL